MISFLWIARLLVTRAQWVALKKKKKTSALSLRKGFLHRLPLLNSSCSNLLLSEKVIEFQCKFRVRSEFQIKWEFIYVSFFSFLFSLFFSLFHFSLSFEEKHFLEKFHNRNHLPGSLVSLTFPLPFFLSASLARFCGNSNKFLLVSL